MADDGRQYGAAQLFEDCRRYKETPKDVGLLSLSCDISDLVEEALELDIRQDMTLEVYRMIHDIVLDRIDAETVGELYELYGEDDTLAKINQLRDRQAKVGTYILLCQVANVTVSPQRFFRHLLPSSMTDLAIHFARSGDYRSLSVVLVRHPYPLEVLDEIDPAVPIEYYCHLLPILEQGQFYGREGKILLSEVFRYVHSTVDVVCSLDDADESAVLNGRELLCIESSEHNIMSWYLQRLERTSQLLPMSDMLIDLMAHFELTMSSVPTLKASNEYKAWCMRRILLRFLSSHEQFAGSEHLVSFSRCSEMETLSKRAFVEGVLHGCRDAASALQSFKEIVLPWTKLFCDHANIDEEVFILILSICSESIVSSWNFDSLKQASMLCSTFSTLSRSSSARDNRVFRTASHLLEYVMKMTSLLVEKACSVLTLQSEYTFVMTCLWEIYETLPIRVDSPEVPESYSSVFDAADDLFKKLRLLDVLTRWNGAEAFITLGPYMSSDDVDPEGLASEGVSMLCDTIFAQAKVHGQEAIEMETIILGFCHDVQEVVLLFPEGQDSLVTVIREFLLWPLWESSLQLLLCLIRSLNPNLLDFNWIEVHLTELFHEVEAGGEISAPTISSLLSCQHLVKSSADLSKELKDLTESLRVYKSLSELLTGTSCCLSPLMCYRLAPAEILVFVLDSLSEEGVVVTRESVLDRILDTLGNLCEASEGLDLATVLLERRETDRAVALCHRILEETTYEVKHVLAIASFVPLIHTQAVNSDIAQGLFRRLLDIPELNLTDVDGETVDILLDPSCSTILTPTKVGRTQSPPTFHRFAYDTQSEYSVNVDELLTTLSEQVTQNQVDDMLLDTLSRYMMYWCIANTTREVRRLVKKHDHDSLKVLLSSATAMMLNTAHDATRTNFISHILHVFEQERTKASNLRSGRRPILPASSFLVESLVQRGYSVAGAVRSVVSSGGKGLDEALQWAIAHSLNANFNQPFVITLPEHDVCADVEGMAVLEQHLKDIQEMFHMLRPNSETDLSFVQSAAPHTKAKHKEAKSETCEPSFESTITPESKGVPMELEKRPQARASPSKDNHCSDVLSPNTRSNMKTRGLEVFSSMRSARGISQEERKRMVEEGRRLLQRSRKQGSFNGTKIQFAPGESSTETGPQEDAGWDFDEDDLL